MLYCIDLTDLLFLKDVGIMDGTDEVTSEVDEAISEVLARCMNR